MYASAALHLHFFCALQLSCPDAWAHICAVLCVCVDTHTRHTFTVPFRFGESARVILGD